MLFDDDFLENIQEDPTTSLVTVVSTTISTLKNKTKLQYDQCTENDYEVLFEGFSLILSMIDSFEMDTNESIPILSGSYGRDGSRIYTFLLKIQNEYSAKATEIKLNLMKNKFNRTLGQSFSYEFSQGDLDRIQILINELREQINSSNLFEQKHKERLLKRLEKLQAEMHKKMSDVDKFWGLIGDAGIVMGKFGKDSKPFVDRMKEISDIVWRTQSRAEELPSGTPPPLLQDDT